MTFSARSSGSSPMTSAASSESMFSEDLLGDLLGGQGGEQRFSDVLFEFDEHVSPASTSIRRQRY